MSTTWPSGDWTSKLDHLRSDVGLAGIVRRPKILDLFCCAGGAGMGYDRAGFDVYGVDIDPQPRYPFAFHVGDALAVLDLLQAGFAVPFVRKDGNVEWLYFEDFAVIHASPPCQAYSSMKHMPDSKEHAELIEPTRDALIALGKPWVIENVVGAPLIDSVILCGSMFGLGAAGFNLQRHRQFESNIALTAPGVCNHDGPTIGVYGGHVRCRSSKFWRSTGADFPGMDKKALANEAMGIDWMTMNQLSEAIPPAYTEHVGSQIIASLSVVPA